MVKFEPCRSRATGEFLSFAQPKERNQRKRCPGAASSFASAPHLGRLAQLDQTSHSQQWLVLGLEQCAPLIPSDA